MENVNVNTESKRPKLSSDKIQLQYLLKGIDAVREMIQDHPNPGPTLRKAFESLRDDPEVTADTDPLALLVGEHTRETSGQRGREAPGPGTTRSYKAQYRQKEGTYFLVLPLPTECFPEIEGSEGGVTLDVHFDEGRIVVGDAAD